MATAFLFLGPAPFLKIQTTTSLLEGMAGVGGFGCALVVVSTFSRAETGASEKVFEYNIESYLMISGIT